MAWEKAADGTAANGFDENERCDTAAQRAERAGCKRAGSHEHSENKLRDRNKHVPAAKERRGANE